MASEVVCTILAVLCWEAQKKKRRMKWALCAPIGQCHQNVMEFVKLDERRQKVLSHSSLCCECPDEVSVVVHYDSLHGIKPALVTPDVHFCSWGPASVGLVCYWADMMKSEPDIRPICTTYFVSTLSMADGFWTLFPFAWTRPTNWLVLIKPWPSWKVCCLVWGDWMNVLVRNDRAAPCSHVFTAVTFPWGLSSRTYKHLYFVAHLNFICLSSEQSLFMFSP